MQLLLGRHPVSGEPLLTTATTDTHDAATNVAAPVAPATQASAGSAPDRRPATWPATGSAHDPACPTLEAAAAGVAEAPSRGHSSSGHSTDHRPPGALPDPRCFLPVRTELRVHMSADTLLGLDDQTCELQGYGPITADQARRLALTQTGSTTLRRVFTDPADDSLLFLDAGSYRFTTAQQEHILALHPISVFPGATTSSERCDIDHLDPYQHAPPGRRDVGPPYGQTIVTNGQPLGRRHHRAKTHHGWSVTRDPTDPHRFCWTTPHGHTAVVDDRFGA